MSKNHWFRVKNNLVHDPKVQRLAPKLFKALINLWCLASQNDGVLPSVPDCAHALHLSEKKMTEILFSLFSLNFFDKNEDDFVPHKWEDHQRPSDSSTTRTKAYRERERSQERKCDGLEKRREEIEIEKRRPPKPPKGEIEFEEFWNAFPNKVGKRAALKAFLFARKRGASAGQIVAGVGNYLRTKPPDKPWCNPATFLNQDRWLDEIAPVQEPDRRSEFRKALDNLGGGRAPGLGTEEEFFALSGDNSRGKGAPCQQIEQRASNSHGSIDLIGVSTTGQANGP
jgi:hypothetical protein